MTDHQRRLHQLQLDYDRLKRDFTLTTLRLAREFIEVKAQLDALIKMQGVESGCAPAAPTPVEG